MKINKKLGKIYKIYIFTVIELEIQLFNIFKAVISKNFYMYLYKINTNLLNEILLLV